MKGKRNDQEIHTYTIRLRKGKNMTRKDYELIAGVLANLNEMVDDYVLEAIAEVFADSLAGTNANFNRDRFITACGVTN
jgi:hypothetical protein